MGVSEPLELFEIGDSEAPFQPPPDGAKVYRVVADGERWLPVREVKHSLPAERDAFVGRSADLQRLDRLFGDTRLVSVLGIGGTGKTRLVTRFGWTWLGDYPGGVWFCDLSEARSVDGIASAVAQAIEVSLGKGDPVVQLGHAIAGRGPCLVILDNFEQVARLAPDTVGRWLDRASEARFVVTTREILGLPGESALPLAPLLSDDSVDLFVARARQAKPGFEPTDTASIRALVALLDGLPLAIELAAARVRVMPPKTLLQRMSQRFKLLASRGGRHTRQATLRGTLDWSWDLLEPDEQAALAQLSVFEGGLTLEAAEGVLALEALWPTDAVQALVDKSMVRQVTDERFDLLVSVQEYAAEKLALRGGREEAEERHGSFFAELGSEQGVHSLNTHGGVARVRELARELDNLVAGCRRSVARGASEPGVALLRATWELLRRTGPVALGIDLAEQVTAMKGLSPEGQAAAGGLRARALLASSRMDEARTHYEAALVIHRELGDRPSEGAVLGDLGDMYRLQGRTEEAHAHLEAALMIHRELGDRHLEGHVRGGLGSLHLDRGRMDEARTHLDAALAIHCEFGDRRKEGITLGQLGVLHYQQGWMDEACAHYDAALAVHREVGNRPHEGMALGNLGILYKQQGRMDEAHAHLDASLAVAREVGDRQSEGVALGNLGNLLSSQDRMDEACAHYYAALAVGRETGNRPAEGIVLGNLGKLHHEQGRMAEARAHYEAALVVHREVAHRRAEGYVLSDLGTLDMEEGRIEEARAHLRDGEQLLRSVDDPNQLAVLLCFRAHLEARDGDLDAARAALADAQALAERTGAEPDSKLGHALAKARATVEDGQPSPAPEG